MVPKLPKLKYWQYLILHEDFSRKWTVVSRVGKNEKTVRNS
jgi:hypothetical protein